LTSNEGDRRELHDLYEGYQNYESKSGTSGTGIIFPPDNDSLIIMPYYRASTKRLSVTRPSLVLGTLIMVPTEGLSKGPAVAKVGERYYFMESVGQIIAVLKGLYKDFENHEAHYKYLNQNFEQKKFTIQWAGTSWKAFSGGTCKPVGLPFAFENYVGVMGVMIPDVLKGTCEKISFLESKMNIVKIEGRLVRKGYLGVPKELIEGKNLFPGSDVYKHLNGWVSQSVGGVKTIYKRVADGTKIYMALEMPDGTTKETTVSISEWHNKPTVTDWVMELIK